MRVLGFLLIALAGAAARAADPPPAESDAIASAKRDFALIKPSSSPLDAGASVGAKADGGGADAAVLAPAAGPSAVEATGKRAGTGNWLVDAMELKADRPRVPGGPEQLTWGDLDLVGGAGRLGARGGSEMSLAQGGGVAASKALAGHVYNPLDAFMDGWISAQDRDLLLPSRGATPEQGLPIIDLVWPGSVAGDGLGLRNAAQGDLKAPSNPYIADLGQESIPPPKPLSSPEPPGYSPFALPDPFRGMLVPGADTKLLDPTRAPIPDLSQPTDDGKYFKPLKKF